MVPSIKLSQCFKTFCIGHPSIDFKQVEISSFCNTTFSKPFSNFFVFIFISFKVSSQNFDLGYSTLYATKYNLPHYRRNELCYLGFVFAIDRKLVVVGNTHGVQTPQYGNFFSPIVVHLPHEYLGRVLFIENMLPPKHNQTHPYQNCTQTSTQLCIPIVPLPYNFYVFLN